LKAKIWNYPRPTRRKSGKTVNSPRDIYDTGHLHDDLIEIDVVYAKGSDPREGRIIIFLNEYAKFIVTGWVSAKGTIVPPRDFVARALRSMGLEYSVF
jgi:hypothetical protein